MVDIVTDLGSVDDDWHYLALVEDVHPDVELTLGARLLAGNDDDVWVIEVLDVRDGVVRFKLIERARPSPHLTLSRQPAD